MAFKKLRDRLNRKYAEQVFLDAQRAMLTPPRVKLSLVAAYVLSAVILTIPLGLFVCGVWIIVASWFNILSTCLGLLLVVFAWLLVPRARLNDKKTFTREDFPELFALLDAVSDKLGTPSPVGVHVIDDFNAYAALLGRFRREKIVGIGAPLWRGMTPQERIAIIAHEMAHFVNDDPARTSITGYALQTVEEWEYFFSPIVYRDQYGNDWVDVMAEFGQWVISAPVRMLGGALLLLQFNRSQRAEYMADGLAAQVGGTVAMIGALRKFDLLPLMQKAVQGLYPFGNPQNARIFDVMAKAVIDPSPEDRATYEQRAAAEMHRVDDSHPATIYRVGFLQALGAAEPQLDASDFDFCAMDQEMAGAFDRVGKRLMQRYEDTTM